MLVSGAGQFVPFAVGDANEWLYPPRVAGVHRVFDRRGELVLGRFEVVAGLDVDRTRTGMPLVPPELWRRRMACPYI